MALNINGTTGISGVDGSASAPALTGTDSNTGINFGTDTVNINTNGTTRATVDSAGNVGLGSTSPTDYDGAADNLVVKGTGNTGITIATTNTASNTSLVFSDGTGSADDKFRGSVQYIHNGDVMRFLTGSAERCRVYQYGMIFSRSDDTINTSNYGTVIALGGFYTSRNVTGASVSGIFYGSQGECLIHGDGDILNTNGSYGQVSDETLKQDIVDAASQWDDIKNIRVRKFRFKDNPTGVLQIGVVAQEVEKVSPGLVAERYKNPKLESGEKVKGVKYSVLHMKAVKALQEAMARIETLEAEKTQMQADLTALTARVAALEAG